MSPSQLPQPRPPPWHNSSRIVRRAATMCWRSKTSSAPFTTGSSAIASVLGTSDTKPNRILVLHPRFDIDQKRRDDRVGEPGHRRGHHAQKLEDGVIAKHRLRRRQAGKEIGELLH